MAAISHVFTIRRAAQILGRDEDLLWDLLEQFEPEDGLLWVYDIDEVEVPAFTSFGLDNLREIIADQIDRVS
jgi:hypothetical protein